MTQTLNVEKEELLARAAEIDEPLPAPPSGNPQAPCALSFVVGAATQLSISADSMRLYLGACEREWRRLAQSLRNAAKAYEEVDEGAGEAIDATMAGVSEDGTTVMSASASSIPPPMISSGGCEDETPPPPPPPPPPFEYPYYEVRQAAADIEAPDQGTAFKRFAEDWDSYPERFQKMMDRFRPFTQWDGLATAAVEANFELHRQWIYSMVQLCYTLASQAKAVTAAHKYAITEHPSAYEVSEADKWYKRYAEDPFLQRYLYQVIEWYGTLQKKSEEVLAEYVKRATLPLPPVYPKNPPTAYRIDPPPEPPPPEPEPDPDDEIPDDELPDDELPDDGLPDDDDLSDTPMTPSTPSAGTPPTGVPPMPDTAALTDALEGLSPAGAGMGAGMKPASVGGGGGGVPGIPSMPMQPPVGAESVAPPGAGAGTPNPGRGLPGAGGGMGGPMGGMAPMAGGQGQGKNDKGERGPSEDESLYEEERPWTEAVIGNRRRQGAPDSKESK